MDPIKLVAVITIPPTRPNIHGFSLKKVYPCMTLPTTRADVKIASCQYSAPFISTNPNKIIPIGACSEKFLSAEILRFRSSLPPSPDGIFFPRLIWITPSVKMVHVVPSAIPAIFVKGNFTTIVSMYHLLYSDCLFTDYTVYNALFRCCHVKLLRYVLYVMHHFMF